MIINKNIISLDCVLICSSGLKCDTSIHMWFLIEYDEDIIGHASSVKILQSSERLLECTHKRYHYGTFLKMFEESEQVYYYELALAAVVYLLIILESVTKQTAEACNIESTCKTKKGKLRNLTFRELLTKLDSKCSIILKSFLKMDANH